MSAAKQKVKLAEFGIDNVRQKKAITGGLILEIGGPECTSKANALASRLTEVLGDMDARIARPIKSGEVRVMDLDESITPDDVADAVAKAGDCSVQNIKVGQIRSSPAGLGTIWVRCPLSAVHKLAAAKRICIGWASVRVEVLEARPMQCYRCLEPGHVRAKCPNEQDRSNRCFACGENNHKASQCTARELNCPVCADLGRPANHRLGSKKCSPPKSMKKKQQGLHTKIQGSETALSGSPTPTGHNPIEVNIASNSIL